MHSHTVFPTSQVAGHRASTASAAQAPSSKQPAYPLGSRKIRVPLDLVSKQAQSFPPPKAPARVLPTPWPSRRLADPARPRALLGSSPTRSAPRRAVSATPKDYSPRHAPRRPRGPRDRASAPVRRSHDWGEMAALTAENFGALQSLLKVNGGVGTGRGALCPRGFRRSRNWE